MLPDPMIFKFTTRKHGGTTITVTLTRKTAYKFLQSLSKDWEFLRIIRFSVSILHGRSKSSYRV